MVQTPNYLIVVKTPGECVGAQKLTWIGIIVGRSLSVSFIVLRSINDFIQELSFVLSLNSEQ